MVQGVLIYSVVLGFFNDYTSILHTGTYSTTFAVAIVMQLLTYLTFMIKDIVKAQFKDKIGRRYTAGLVFGVWLVLFLSKFVFLWAISVIFRDEVYISGFVGLLVIIIIMTLADRLIGYIDRWLATKTR